MESEFRYAECEKLPKGEGLRAYNERFWEFYGEIKDKNNLWNQVWDSASELRKNNIDKEIDNTGSIQDKLSLKRTKNLAKVYAAHQLFRWKEELQQEMAVRDVTQQNLKALVQNQEIAEQDYSNWLETRLKADKWPDESSREDFRKAATEFAGDIISKGGAKSELLFKKEVERMIAVAHLGLAKIKELPARLANKVKEVSTDLGYIEKKKEMALLSAGLSLVAIGCISLNQIELNNSSIVGSTDIANADRFRVTETTPAPATYTPTLENAINPNGVVELMPTVSPMPKATETSQPTATEKSVDYYSWLNPAQSIGENLDLSQPFSLSTGQKTAEILGYRKLPTLVTGNIEINAFHDAQTAVDADWGKIFENPIGDMNAAAIEQGNNGRAIVYCHSGSVAGIEWPCNWVKTAAWYPERIIGQEVNITQGNTVYHFEVDAINTVSKNDYENSARVFSDPNRPMMRDLAGLTENPEAFNKPGIDIVVCGGKEVTLHDYRTIMSLELVSAEKLMSEGITAGTFSESEINPKEIQNLEMAAENVTNYFESNPLTPGKDFSYLKANGYFSENGWLSGSDFIYAGGACDIATLLNRSVKNYSSLIGLPYEYLKPVDGRQIWGNAIFEVSLIPHGAYPGKPEDEVLVSAPNRSDDSGNTDYKINLKDTLPNGDLMPINFKIAFRIEPDGKGGFISIIESNYSIEEMRRLVSGGLTSDSQK